MEQRTHLAEIFAWEKQEDWSEAFRGYTALYGKEPSIETAIHFAFFCWYMLWQWDEIQLTGEVLSPYERMKTENRCGLSRPVLFRDLDRTAEYLLADGRGTPARYLAVLVHMRKIYPYFFKEETFPESMACHLLDQIRKRGDGEPGVQAICRYVQDGAFACIPSREKAAAKELFPRGSLLSQYFVWLFSE